MDIKEYIRNKRHVPEFLKDFHDAKDFFKMLWEWQHKGEPMPELDAHSWISQHIFTMDVLLPFLALCGYRLEKIRLPKMACGDLSQTIKEYKERELQALASMLDSKAAARKDPETGASKD